MNKFHKKLFFNILQPTKQKYIYICKGINVLYGKYLYFNTALLKKNEYMGQAKKMLMEFEEKVSIIDDLISILSSEHFEYLCDHQLISDLYVIRNTIGKLDSSSMSMIDLASNIITDYFYSIYSELRLLMDSIEMEGRVTDEHKSIFQNLSEKIHYNISKTKRLLREFSINRPSVYNSEIYYKEQIDEIQKQKDEIQKQRDHLVEILNEVQQRQENIQGQSEEEIRLHKMSIKEKEEQLQAANQQILSYRSELEEKKKQENAILEWNTKIKTTFKELSIYLLPIKKEHARLKFLYWAYFVLIVLVILFIVVLEIAICKKFSGIETFPDWRDDLVLMLPIPVTGALLWAFISQLNRAQRQLVVLAKHIHEIEYIEGLLLSLNSLSININDSMMRVNSAIDRLLDNHLSMGAKHSRYDEESIVKEEKKDMIPSDVILKILKEIKGIAVK